MWTLRASLLVVLALVFYVIGLINDLISVYFLTSFVACSVGLCFLLALFSLTGLSFSFDLDSERVAHGTPVIVRLKIQNSARARKGPAAVQLRVRNETLQQSYEQAFFFDPVSARDAVEVMLPISDLGRGVYECELARIQASDPLGLFRSRLRLYPKLAFLVQPSTWPLDAPVGRPQAAGSMLEQAGALLSSAGLEFAATRPFAEGDDSRYIHWPSTARHGRLIVRQFHTAMRPSAVILVRLIEGGAELPFGELAVRAAASLADFALRRGHEVAMVALGRETRTVPFDSGSWHRSRIMDALTRIQYPRPGEPGKGASPWFRSSEARVVRYLLAAMPSNAAVHLITCASEDPLVRYLHLHRRAGSVVSQTGLASSTELRFLFVGPAGVRSRPGVDRVRYAGTEEEVRAALSPAGFPQRHVRTA